MKKILALLLFGNIIYVSAQESSDAMRISQNQLYGTARYNAMAGAFGALGGDLSALNNNPASSAVLNHNQIVFTASNIYKNNSSNYFGSTFSTNTNEIDINQAGLALVFKNVNKNGGAKKIAIAINYEKVKSFKDDLAYFGTNPNYSIADYFLYYAQGKQSGQLEEGRYANSNFGTQQAIMGKVSSILNPINNNSNNTEYISNVAPGGRYYQENTITASGNNNKVNFNLATQFNDNLYFGVNVNAYFYDYNQLQVFYEDNNNNVTNDYMVRKVEFTNQLNSYGTGLSFQAGVIAKLSNQLRVGLSYESPTWYTLYDEFSQQIYSLSTNANGNAQRSNFNPSVTNVYDPYTLQTPEKIVASAALVFDKKGILSFDYIRQNYSKTKYKPSADFETSNNFMANNFASTNEFRVGAEAKFGNKSLRAGYRYEDSPYLDKITVGSQNNYSIGFGYQLDNIRWDFSYNMLQSTSKPKTFSQGFTESASFKHNLNTFNASLVIHL